MKKINLAVIFTVMVIMVFGCSPLTAKLAIDSAVGLANTGPKSTDVSMVVDYPIGGYIIKATNYRGGGATIQRYQNKKIIGDEITIAPESEYSQMTIGERKEFIKKEYLKRGIILEPDQTETAQKSPTPSLSRDIPTTGFAPKPQ